MQALSLGFERERVFPYRIRVCILRNSYVYFNFVVCPRLQAPQLRQAAPVLDSFLQPTARGFTDISKKTKDIEQI
ncbi:hypothetical protein GCM10011400_40140 [Paraburkholderia caffeinilytica]|uniref:Uncharacterized protein n=1 Tax=Paraburkholderia caffeinilytica TaxID=1761016 RepID=A0ABQ1N203_9BURK|nr:hypothetical protein GCM10011400_40140 [Paraburkholderia caffeinilytica]